MSDPDGKDGPDIGEINFRVKKQMGLDSDVEMFFDMLFKQIYQYISTKFLKGVFAKKDLPALQKG